MSFTFEKYLRGEDLYGILTGFQLCYCGVVKHRLGELLHNGGLESTVELLVSVRADHVGVVLHRVDLNYNLIQILNFV